MKNLLLDTCTKTASIFNGVIYEQRDGARMECSLSSLLANIIIANLEENVINSLINNNTIKFYARYVDVTVFVIKREDVRPIQDILNSFDPNLHFTVDLFQNEVPCFQDLEVSPDDKSIFKKNTNTGLYTHFSSHVPWTHRSGWIKSLTFRRSRTRSQKNKKSSEINVIKNLASWNSFPRSVAKDITHQVLNTTDEISDKSESPEVLAIYVRTFYYSVKDFRYSSLTCAKFDLTVSKLVLLNLRLTMMLIKLAFVATPKIKQLFCVIRFSL